MRILHVVARSHRRGAEFVALELAEELTLLRHDNHVVALGLGLEGGRDDALPTLTRTTRVGFDVLIRCALRLRREVARRPVDLILAHGGWSATAAALAFPRRGPKLVWQRILGLPAEAWRQSRIWQWRAVARRMDGASVLTRGLGQEMRRLGFAGPLWTIPNARRLGRFESINRREEGEALRRDLDLGSSTALVGFVGHLVEQKRPERALEVINRVLAAGEDAHLVVAGDGPLRQSLEHEVRDRGLGDRVSLLGHRNDIEHIFGALDVALLTSAAEGIPGVAIEAQMAGCPLVSFPLGGVSEVVKSGMTGEVISRADVGEMAGTVVGLIRDPERARLIGEQALAHASAFSLGHAAVSYEKQLGHLVKGDGDSSTETGLALYWYWPFARAEDIDIAAAAMRPGDSMVIQTLDRPGVPVSGPEDPYVILNDGPEVRPVRELSLRWALSRSVTYLARIWGRHRAVWSTDFDVVHLMFVNRFTDSFDLGLLRRRNRLVCSVHDIYPHQPRLPQRLEHRLLRAQFRSTDLLLVHNERLRSLLVDDFGIPTENIEIVAHQVPEFTATARREPEDPPLVLFFGTLRRNKGIEVLVQAIRELPRADIRFHFAGRGFEDMETLVRDLARADDRVSADLTWITAELKADLYQRASLVALPYTRFESESGVLHDAYGHGRPVVATEVGSLGAEVRDSGTGWVVPAGDAGALGQAIMGALEDPAGYQQAAAAARAVAHARRPQAIGAQLREVYDRLAPSR